MTQPETEKRVRLGCMIKPSNLAAIKSIKEATGARSEGVVVDDAIERLSEAQNENSGK